MTRVSHGSARAAARAAAKLRKSAATIERPVAGLAARPSRFGQPGRIAPKLFLGLLLAGLSTVAAGREHRAMLDGMSHALVGLNAAYQQADRGKAQQALAAVMQAAEERQAVLKQLMADDPAAALQAAMPDHVRGGLPSEVQALIEQRRQIEGELQVVYEHPPAGGWKLRQFIDTVEGRVELHVAGEPPGLMSGTQVSTFGVQVDDAIAVESAGYILALAADGGSDGGCNGGTPGPVATPLGEQRVLVVMYKFQDTRAEPFTREQAQSFMFGKVSDYFREASYGQTWLTGDTVGWLTVPVAAADCAATDDAVFAGALANAGIDPSQYSRVVSFVAPSSCTDDSATVGGIPSAARISAGLDLQVVTHELGHNFGLFHSHGQDCDQGAWQGSCQQLEYGDLLDAMGQTEAHFNAFQKTRLGWLDNGQSPPVTNVITAGNYSIYPYSAQDNRPKALRIARGTAPDTGQRQWYYIEYRQPVGFDQALFDPADNTRYPDNLNNGVVVRAATESDPNSSLLLDMTPQSITTGSGHDLRDPALVVGQSYTDELAGLRITPVQVDGSVAVVNVSFGAAVCDSQAPGLVVAPTESPWVAPGTPVMYTLEVTNRDSESCGATRFDLEVAAPAGWSANMATGSLLLDPGTTGVADVVVTSPAGAGDGSYELNVSAVNSTSGLRASAAATYAISTPTPVNQDPVAMPDSAVTEQDRAVIVAVLGNDSDPDGDALQLASVGPAASGQARIRTSGSIEYVPNPGFFGRDRFSYTVTDGKGGSAGSTVAIEVTEVVAEPPAPLNQDPVAMPDSAVTDQDQAVIVAVLGNDSDPDGDALQLASVGPGANGSAQIRTGGAIEYTPNPGFVGRDRFSYAVADGRGGWAATTVDVEVMEVVAEPSSPLTVTGLSPNSVRFGASLTTTVSGTGFEPGARVSFAGGAGPTPAAVVEYVDGSTLRLSIKTKSGGPLRNRYWDVIVTNPDGGTASLAQGLVVLAEKGWSKKTLGEPLTGSKVRWP